MQQDLSGSSCLFEFVLRLVGSLNSLVKIIGGIILCAMSVAVFASVFSRYFMNYSLTWIEEAATLGMAWLCALGAGLAARKGDMTAVTLGIMFLPYKVRKICRIASCLICLALFAIVIDAGIKMAAIARMQRVSSIPQLSMFWVNIALPIGLAVMFINTVVRMIEIGKEKEAAK